MSRPLAFCLFLTIWSFGKFFFIGYRSRPDMVILGVATADAIFVFPDGNSHIEPIRPNLSTTIFIFSFFLFLQQTSWRCVTKKIKRRVSERQLPTLSIVTRIQMIFNTVWLISRPSRFRQGNKTSFFFPCRFQLVDSNIKRATVGDRCVPLASIYGHRRYIKCA